MAWRQQHCPGQAVAQGGVPDGGRGGPQGAGLGIDPDPIAQERHARTASSSGDRRSVSRRWPASEAKLMSTVDAHAQDADNINYIGWLPGLTAGCLEHMGLGSNSGGLLGNRPAVAILAQHRYPPFRHCSIGAEVAAGGAPDFTANVSKHSCGDQTATQLSQFGRGKMHASDTNSVAGHRQLRCAPATD